MKHLTEETKAKLISILRDKIKAEIEDENTIDLMDFECFHNGFGFFPSVTVAYSTQELGDSEATGQVYMTNISLVHVDYAEFRDREEQVIPCTPQQKKEIEVYLLEHL